MQCPICGEYMNTWGNPDFYPYVCPKCGHVEPAKNGGDQQ